MFWNAVLADGEGDRFAVDRWVELIARCDFDAFAPELDRLVAHQLREVWDAGWQPEVLHHVVRRELGAAAARALSDAVAAEAEEYETLGRQVAGEWMAQLDSIGASRWWSTQQPRLLQVAEPSPDSIGTLAAVVSLIGRLPALPVLGPPPSTWRAGDQRRVDDVSSDVLRRVRSLLAKAESSNFEAEADTFTAKAQELMARHRIDRALLDADATTSASEVTGRLIVHDDPYAESKALLLSTVCARNGGFSVFTKGFGFSTVFASPIELDIIEDLFTSLLVQATAAMRREGARVDPSGRRRTARFRRSFLAGFADRIGQRLSEAVERTIAEAERETGASVAVVLAGRADRATEEAQRHFPQTISRSSAAADGAGWLAGQVSADHADLAVGPPVEATGTP